MEQKGRARRYTVRVNGAPVGQAWVSAPVELGESAVLTGVYVEPAYRRRGHGTRLLKRIVDDHAESGLCGTLQSIGSVTVAQEALRRFYRRAGARIIRRFGISWPGTRRDNP